MTAAAGGEGEGAHVHRRRLQRDPRGDGVGVAERPVVLVGVPGGDAAAAFLVEGLVVVHPHTFDAHQLRGDAGEALAHDELFDRGVFFPDVADLQERLAVGIAL